MNKFEDKVNRLQKIAKAHGKYAEVSKSSGVGYEWLSKFASGQINNPTLRNLSLLEDFFCEQDKVA